MSRGEGGEREGGREAGRGGQCGFMGRAMGSHSRLRAELRQELQTGLALLRLPQKWKHPHPAMRQMKKHEAHRV